VLYNGIDVDRFHGSRDERGAVRERWGIPSDAPVLGVVGRLSRGKGHEEFLQTAALLATREPKMRFLVVGDGGLRPEMETLRERLNLRERVVFTGHRNDVPELLGAMDLFFFSSLPDEVGRIQDGLPGVAIEAQAAGLPVVAFRLPMMDEVVVEGASGTLVPVGDVEAAALACLDYFRDSTKRETASRAALRQALRFSLSACLENTLGHYEELLRLHSRGT
jgi:glycosyltransferase involved in cell wall biosynthesis